MNRPALRALLVCAAVVAATACAPESGEVIDRDYDEAYTWIDQQCTTTLQPNGQSIRTCVPVTRYVDESFSLRLDNGQDTGWRRVPEREYDRCHVGDQYPACAAAGR